MLLTLEGPGAGHNASQHNLACLAIAAPSPFSEPQSRFALLQRKRAPLQSCHRGVLRAAIKQQDATSPALLANGGRVCSAAPAPLNQRDPTTPLPVDLPQVRVTNSAVQGDMSYNGDLLLL